MSEKDYMYACKKCGGCFYASPNDHAERKGLCRECFERSGEEYAKIVRCKDCKHHGTMDCPMCEEADCTFMTADNWYCADGERQEGR